MNEPAASAASWQAVHSRPAKAQRRDPRKSKRGAFSRRLSRAQWSRGGEAAHAEGATIVGVFGGGGEQRRVSAAAGCVTGGAEEVAATQSKIHPANSPASSRVRPLARPSHPAIPPRLIKTRGPPPYTPRPRPRTARGPRACAAGCRAVRPFSNGRQGGAPSFAAATPCMQNASPLHGSSGEPGTGRPHARHRERLRLRGGGRGKQTRTRRTSGKNTAPARAPSRRDRHALLGMCQALAQSQGARAPPNPLVATRAGGGTASVTRGSTKKICPTYRCSAPGPPRRWRWRRRRQARRASSSGPWRAAGQPGRRRLWRVEAIIRINIPPARPVYQCPLPVRTSRLRRGWHAGPAGSPSVAR